MAVRKIAFTGSTAIGKSYAKQAGEHMKPVLMELGCKAPALVLDDAGLELAAEQCALGAFFHADQISMSTERGIVEKQVVEPLKRILKATIEKNFGSQNLINGAAVKKNVALVGDATSKGVNIHYGNVEPIEGSGTRLGPIVVDNVSKVANLHYSESFGPSVSVSIAEEAVRLANDTEHGLSSAVS